MTPKKYYKKVWFWLLIIFIVLPAINYCVFDFGSLAFCDYKSIVDDKIYLSKSYNFIQVAQEARKHGVKATIGYLNYVSYSNPSQIPANVADLEKKYGLYLNTFDSNGHHFIFLSGPQLGLTVSYFGATYDVTMRYDDSDFSKVYILFSNGREKSACMTPNLLIRFFMWKMFYNSGMETGWLWHTQIHHVIYWGPSL